MILFLNDRVIVPESLRSNVLSQLHTSHLGIEKTKKRVRTLLYWPRNHIDIENMVTKCNICQKYKSANVKEPLFSHEVPQIPYCKLGIDIWKYAGKIYLVTSDFYSRYLDIYPCDQKQLTNALNT